MHLRKRDRFLPHFSYLKKCNTWGEWIWIFYYLSCKNTPMTWILRHSVHSIIFYSCLILKILLFNHFDGTKLQKSVTARICAPWHFWSSYEPLLAMKLSIKNNVLKSLYCLKEGDKIILESFTLLFSGCLFLCFCFNILELILAIKNVYHLLFFRFWSISDKARWLHDDIYNNNSLISLLADN